MPAYLSRLRRWFAAATIGAVLLVAGAYFYARHSVQNALKQVPEKIGLQIQQSATGFTISKSEQGRTLFTVRAGKAIQFKQGREAELHDVEIILYGRDSGRFDRIYGTDFEYDQQSGDVSARGEVDIDLEANPAGLANPDQAPPKELKNPIHLKTSGLVFNQKTGNAYTKGRIDFSLPQVGGSAVGVDYDAQTNVLTLESQVSLVFSGPTAGTVTARHGALGKNPRVVTLDSPRLQNGLQRAQADGATLYLREDNTVGRMLAFGNVSIQSEGAAPSHLLATQLELLISPERHTLQTAVLRGDVRLETGGVQPVEGRADSMVLNFATDHSITKARAQDNVRLSQHPSRTSVAANAQDFELDASTLDMFFATGHRIQRAEAFGDAHLVIRPVNSVNPGQQTTVGADKFNALFDDAGQLASIHGAANARIVNQSPGQPDRVSTSSAVDAAFRPGSGIEAIMQQGGVAYVDGKRRAWADHARYTPADQVLTLTGSPRAADGGMTTTAQSLRLNRATGDAFADGDVKTTYSDLKPQPDGALLSSSSPIHVTARSMMVHGVSTVALYTGDARLWQDANAIQAQSIEFDRDHRSMVAYSSARSGPSSPSSVVSTVLIQTDKAGNPTPIAITSSRFSYTDNERQAHFDGDVVTKAAGLTITAKKADAFLHASGRTSPSAPGAGTLDKIVAQEQVAITQSNRRASGDLLIYTAADDKFVLSGGPPSIFDAEHGKITGVSLTFFRHDDRVLVEGNNSSPTVTQTQVAR